MTGIARGEMGEGADLQAQPVERRQAVLDTASRLFARSSYRGATTAEIASVYRELLAPA